MNGAIEGMALASDLNRLTTRTSITTVLRIQGTGFELFWLHTTHTPEQLRIMMSSPRRHPVSTRSYNRRGTQHTGRVVTPSPAEELFKLADMLEKGLLTRDEFNLMKDRLIGQPPT